MFRVHQGTITPGTQLYIGDGRKPVQGRAPVHAAGKEHVEIDEARARGTSARSPRSRRSQFDARPARLARAMTHIHAQAAGLPDRRCSGSRCEPKKRGDEQRLSDVLHKLMAEDPCFRIEHNAAGQRDRDPRPRRAAPAHRCWRRWRPQYKLEVDTRPPKIPYRETIAAPAEGHSRHKKQTGGAGQFGEVFLRIEPLPRGAGFEFVDEVKGGAIPNQFIPAVEKGVRWLLRSGVIAGYPVQDLRVIVYDGKHHAVDSKEIAFVSAGSKALLDALCKARPIVLEPIVNVEIAAPEAEHRRHHGRALAARRGQISGTACAATGALPMVGAGAAVGTGAATSRA